LVPITPPPFQTFLDAHRREVLAFLTAVAGPDDAEDCFQETFIAALRAYDRLRGNSNLRAWVLTIAHRKAIDAGRARARRAVPTDAVPEEPTTDRAMGEEEPELWSLVRGLPPKQRAAVAHRFVAGLSYAEMAPILDCSEEAARRSVHEGLTKLRREWER
jgi:RNA polymerase sigma factor (sigma-70 family)